MAIFCHNFSGNDWHLNFEISIEIAIEKVVGTEEVDLIAGPSENSLSVEIRCLNFFDSSIILNAGLDEISTTKKSIQT